MRMIRSGKFSDKKILLLDKEPKTKNDRTWCFWEKENGFFDEVVYRKWDQVSFLSKEFSSAMNIAPYQYKMIRGIDFYNYCFSEIKKYSNVEVLYGESKGGFYHKEGITLKIDDSSFELEHGIVFNSIYTPNVQNAGICLLQHFKGWIIETTPSFFDADKATLMDFRVSQRFGTAFVYVLPLSDKTALVEYTLFTKNLLQQEEYDGELDNYIRNFLTISNYTVKEKEYGVIPMTNERFQFYRAGVYHIGTAGGQTKASSGYTFQFIQKQSQQIVDYLITGKNLNYLPAAPKRFRFYDNTLLYILYHNKLAGDKIFTQLFKKNKPQQVLRFLDNESSVMDELRIISSLPTWPFLKGAIKQL